MYLFVVIFNLTKFYFINSQAKYSLLQISAQCWVSCRNQSFVLQSDINGWCLYKTQQNLALRVIFICKTLKRTPLREVRCNCSVHRIAHFFYNSNTAQETRFSIKDFFSKCDQENSGKRQGTADLVTFTEEILNGNSTFCVVQ